MYLIFCIVSEHKSFRAKPKQAGKKWKRVEGGGKLFARKPQA